MIMIQSGWRGHQARLLVRQTRAAIVLQAAHRGAAARRQVSIHILQMHSGVACVRVVSGNINTRRML